MSKVDHILIAPLLIYCSDYSGVSKAYEAMKNVASLINERKRRLESIDTIAHWQVAILHWEVMKDDQYSLTFYLGYKFHVKAMCFANL